VSIDSSGVDRGDDWSGVDRGDNRSGVDRGDNGSGIGGVSSIESRVSKVLSISLWFSFSISLAIVAGVSSIDWSGVGRVSNGGNNWSGSIAGDNGSGVGGVSSIDRSRIGRVSKTISIVAIESISLSLWFSLSISLAIVAGVSSIDWSRVGRVSNGGNNWSGSIAGDNWSGVGGVSSIDRSGVGRVSKTISIVAIESISISLWFSLSLSLAIVAGVSSIDGSGVSSRRDKWGSIAGDNWSGVSGVSSIDRSGVGRVSKAISIVAIKSISLSLWFSLSLSLGNMNSSNRVSNIVSTGSISIWSMGSNSSRGTISTDCDASSSQWSSISIGSRVSVWSSIDRVAKSSISKVAILSISLSRCSSSQADHNSKLDHLDCSFTTIE